MFKIILKKKKTVFSLHFMRIYYIRIFEFRHTRYMNIIYNICLMVGGRNVKIKIYVHKSIKNSLKYSLSCSVRWWDNFFFWPRNEKLPSLVIPSQRILDNIYNIPHNYSSSLILMYNGGLRHFFFILETQIIYKK